MTEIQRIEVKEPVPTLTAASAFICYRQNEERAQGHDETYLTHHLIHDGVVGPGQWVNVEALLEQLDRSHRPAKYRAEQAQWLPYRILSISNRMIVWHVPTDKRMLSFTEPRMKPLSGELPVPGLVMAARRNDQRTNLSVFAIKGTPSPNSQLFEAPFPNLFSGGGVCTGSMPTYGVAPADAEKWSDAFFGSEFSHYTYFNYWSAVKRGERPKLKPLPSQTIQNLLR